MADGAVEAVAAGARKGKKGSSCAKPLPLP